MPYCPQCGVELSPDVKACPLCSQEMPELGLPIEAETEALYPAPVNIHASLVRRIRNRIFFGSTVTFLGAVACLAFVHRGMGAEGAWIYYSQISVVAAWVYLFLLLGYLQGLTRTIVGMGFTSLGLAYGIDLVNGSITWAPKVALPLIAVATGLVSLGFFLHRRYRHKNQAVVIPILLSAGVALYCPVVEGIVDLNRAGSISLFWSVLVFIPLMTLALVMLGLYIKLPDRLRSKIRKTFHI